MKEPRRARQVIASAMIAAAAGMVACGSIRSKMDAVVVTAVPADVEKCREVGLVMTDSPEANKTEGLDQLRADAVKKGGNAVLVNSYVLSTTGKAYACDPPLKPH